MLLVVPMAPPAKPGNKRLFLARRKVDKKKLPIIVEVVCRPHNYHNKEVFHLKEKDINSLNHTTWRCQYRIILTLSKNINIYKQNNCHTMT